MVTIPHNFSLNYKNKGNLFGTSSMEEYPPQEKTWVMHQKTWVRNVSQECVINVDNVNIAHPIKNIWVRKIY